MAEIGAGLNSTFPTTLDTDASVEVNTGGAVPTLARAEWANDVADAIIKLETKVGIDSSAVATTLDYKIRNTSSVDPGHKHSKLWESDGGLATLSLGAAGTSGLAILSMFTELNAGIYLRVGTHMELADDGTVALPVISTVGICLVACNAEVGIWSISDAGVCVKLVGTTNTAATDSDANLCVYDGGANAVVKNRLGAVGKTIVILFNG